MEISNKGKDFIKSYEKCILHAYKPIKEEKFYTIGWGHYGADVAYNMTITQKHADDLFDADIKKYVAWVKVYCPVWQHLNQDQFDALCSICYNAGSGNLQKLCKGKTISEIGSSIEGFCVNGSNGKKLSGLVKRRKAEAAMFNTKKDFQIAAHVRKLGWLPAVGSGEIAGTTGEGRRLEAIEIISGYKFTGKAHVKKYGWLPETSGIIGTTGLGLQMEAVILNADTAIRYRVHVQGIGWMDWVTNGQIAGTTGEDRRIEAIEIEVI